jgi:hypothetical protein
MTTASYPFELRGNRSTWVEYSQLEQSKEKERSHNDPRETIERLGYVRLRLTDKTNLKVNRNKPQKKSKV